MSNTITLKLLGLPVIQNLDDFSALTHVSKRTLFQLSKNADKYYKTYFIPKKNGKMRLIAQPSKKLKGIQAWILVHILNRLHVSSSCKGFEKKSSTLSNALPHQSASTIMTIDLKDFFPTVKRNKIYSIFKSAGYNVEVATILTNMCTFEEYLPQGSPCSPRLANLSAWTLDVRIQGYVGRRGINFTRYADDLTFSGFNPAKVVKTYPKIKQIIESEGHEINTKKTRIAGAGRAKIVTGLVISNNAIGIGAQMYKKVRAKIHHLTLQSNHSDVMLLNEVRGWLSYLNSVDERRFNKAIIYATELKQKHPTSIISKLNLVFRNKKLIQTA